MCGARGELNSNLMWRTRARIVELKRVLRVAIAVKNKNNPLRYIKITRGESHHRRRRDII